MPLSTVDSQKFPFRCFRVAGNGMHSANFQVQFSTHTHSPRSHALAHVRSFAWKPISDTSLILDYGRNLQPNATDEEIFWRNKNERQRTRVGKSKFKSAMLKNSESKSIFANGRARPNESVCIACVWFVLSHLSLHMHAIRNAVRRE